MGDGNYARFVFWLRLSSITSSVTFTLAETGFLTLTVT